MKNGITSRRLHFGSANDGQKLRNNTVGSEGTKKEPKSNRSIRENQGKSGTVDNGEPEVSFPIKYEVSNNILFAACCEDDDCEICHATKAYLTQEYGNIIIVPIPHRELKEKYDRPISDQIRTNRSSCSYTTECEAIEQYLTAVPLKSSYIVQP